MQISIFPTPAPCPESSGMQTLLPGTSLDPHHDGQKSPADAQPGPQDDLGPVGSEPRAHGAPYSGSPAALRSSKKRLRCSPPALAMCCSSLDSEIPGFMTSS